MYLVLYTEQHDRAGHVGYHFITNRLSVIEYVIERRLNMNYSSIRYACAR